MQNYLIADIIKFKLNWLGWISFSKPGLLPNLLREHRALVQCVRIVFETTSSQYQMEELISSPETNNRRLYFLFFLICDCELCKRQKVPITGEDTG